MTKRKTAGALSLEAAADTTKYDSLEVGHAITDDVGAQLQICINNHINIINEPEFCVVMQLATDPLIKGVVRKKFFAWPFLPKPRPWQSVFLYTKTGNTLKRLWILPKAEEMAVLSEEQTVPKKYQTMKLWSDMFFDGRIYGVNHFHKCIRKQHNIKLESEHEYLEMHREELIKAGCQEPQSAIAEAFDFTKITSNKVVHTIEPVLDQNIS